MKVDAAAFEGVTLFWSGVDRVVLYQADLTEPYRNETIAHGLAHIEISDKEFSVDALRGISPRYRVEAMVDGIVANWLIPQADLHEALGLADTTAEVARILGVSDYLLAVRLQNLTDREVRSISTPLLDRLGWAPGMGERHHRRCCWPPPGTGDVLHRLPVD